MPSPPSVSTMPFLAPSTCRLAPPYRPQLPGDFYHLGNTASADGVAFVFNPGDIDGYFAAILSRPKPASPDLPNSKIPAFRSYHGGDAEQSCNLNPYRGHAGCCRACWQASSRRSRRYYAVN